MILILTVGTMKAGYRAQPVTGKDYSTMMILKFDAGYFGWRVQQRRVDFRLSLRELADQVGISAATLSRIERGNMPDLLSFGQLCAWMNEDASRFFVADPEKC